MFMFTSHYETDQYHSLTHLINLGIEIDTDLK